jgi:CheY-like chemotaxis protein
MTDLTMELLRDHGKLLVVDDEPFLRDAVAASLRFLGFDVITAETGAGALRLARGRPFDLIVLDVMLPDTGGFDVVRRLRRDGRGSRGVGRQDLGPGALAPNPWSIDADSLHCRLPWWPGPTSSVRRAAR